MSPPRRRRASKRSGARNRPAPAREFWGSDAAGDPGTVIVPGADPTALVESLGPLPFPRGAIAKHYFDAVYERAAALAVALATAADLTEPPVPDDAAPADAGVDGT